MITTAQYPADCMIQSKLPVNPSKRELHLDILRGIAVIAVMLFHAFPDSIPGGYAGVDVFFVLSGYLISRSLYYSTKKSDLSGFCRRRIERLVPPFIAVSSITLIVYLLISTQAEIKPIAKSLLASNFIFSNYFHATEVNYFSEDIFTQPFLHHWSLSLEWQFYIFAFGISLAISKKSLQPLLILTLLIFGIFNFWVYYFYESSIYFLFFPRVISILLGCAVFFWMNNSRNSKESRSPFISFTAICCLFTSFSIANAMVSVPIASMATALLIISGLPDNSSFIYDKVAKIAHWFGLRSYSLYLWHWPILVAVHVMSYGLTPKPEFIVIAIVLSVILSHINWIFLEKLVVEDKKNVISVNVSIISMVVLSFFSYLVITKHITVYSRYNVPDKNDYVIHLPAEFNDSCLQKIGIIIPSNIRYCAGSLKRDAENIAVIGDSHAAAAFPGISSYNEKELNGEYGSILLAGRPFANVVAYPSGNEWERKVSEGGAEVVEFVAHNDDISTIVIVARGYFYLDWATNFFVKSAPGVFSGKEIYNRGMIHLFESFQSKRVILVLENPTLPFKPVKSCGKVRPFALIENQFFDCSFDKSIYLEEHSAYRSEMKKLAQLYENVVLFDPAETFCSVNVCRGAKSGVVLYSDRNHLNLAGSLLQGVKLGGLIKDVVDRED